ncbi:MAG TPA: hypothetical protein VJ719_13700 [Chthoniobacterales bacterium]|nr:hypothetical protein [Chthoniobacterales bacterium]
MPKILGQSNAQRRAIRILLIFRSELARLNSMPRSGTIGRITSPAPLLLSPDRKLELLRQLDRWRPWRSLDDQRLCLGCGRLILGHEIEMVPTGNGEEGPIELRCPTHGCQSIPLDWILPTSSGRKNRSERVVPPSEPAR